jgi:hypothetical protein
MVVPVLHARRVAYTRQGGHSLDRCVWVTACLPGCGWGFFSGSEVFRRISDAAEVSGGSACSTHTVAGDGDTNAGLGLGFCLGFFMLFFLFFS